MKTVKLKILNEINIRDIQRVYSSMVRFSFNRLQEGLREKEIRSILKSKFPPNAWLQQNAFKDAAAVFEKFKDKRIVFGSKKNLIRYLKGLISKEEFKENRLRHILIQGEINKYGNRFFDLTRLSESVIESKFSKKDHQKIIFAYPRSLSLVRELKTIEELCRKKAITVTVELSKEYISLKYDEKLVRDEQRTFKKLKSNRVLGIDLNPNYIGLSVLEFNQKDEYKVLHKQLFDLTELNKHDYDVSKIAKIYGIKDYKKPNNVTTDKRNYELIKICHQIKDLVDYWKCSKLVIEDLNIESSDHGNKTSNRLINNCWNRNLVVKKLKMLGNIYNFEIVEINPAYSSFIGNVEHGDTSTPDPIAASIEIGRRGYKKYTKGWFYPKFDIGSLKEQWKQTLDGCQTWKDAFQKLKTLDMKYRVQLKDTILNAVFRQEYTKRHIIVYAFR